MRSLAEAGGGAEGGRAAASGEGAVDPSDESLGSGTEERIVNVCRKVP